MEVTIFMKSPDALDHAIDDALEGITDEDVRVEKEEEIRVACNEWMKYGECVELIIDTETKTCEVVKAVRRFTL